MFCDPSALIFFPRWKRFRYIWPSSPSLFIFLSLLICFPFPLSSFFFSFFVLLTPSSFPSFSPVHIFIYLWYFIVLFSILFVDVVDSSKFVYKSHSRVAGAQVVLSGKSAACNRRQCALLCTNTQGCVGFNHRKDAGCMCAPITVASGLYDAPVPDANWQLWTWKLY